MSSPILTFFKMWHHKSRETKLAGCRARIRKFIYLSVSKQLCCEVGESSGCAHGPNQAAELNKRNSVNLIKAVHRVLKRSHDIIDCLEKSESLNFFFKILIYFFCAGSSVPPTAFSNYGTWGWLPLSIWGLSSLVRGRTHIPCIGMWILYP